MHPTYAPSTATSSTRSTGRVRTPPRTDGVFHVASCSSFLDAYCLIGAVQENEGSPKLVDDTQATGSESILNGVTWDLRTDNIFVTGKSWPKLYVIQLTERASARAPSRFALPAYLSNGRSPTPECIANAALQLAALRRSSTDCVRKRHSRLVLIPHSGRSSSTSAAARSFGWALSRRAGRVGGVRAAGRQRRNVLAARALSTTTTTEPMRSK